MSKLKINSKILNTYLISNNYIFSKKEKSIILFKNLPNIEILEIDFVKNNESIIKQLNNILRNSEKIKIYENIKSFENIKFKIEEKFTKKNINYDDSIFKIKSDDYEFIEETSQIEILTEILNENQSNILFLKLKDKLEKYIKKNNSKEEKLIFNLKKKKEKFEKIILEIKEKIKINDNLFKNIGKDKKNLEIKIDILNQEILKFKNSLNIEEKKEKLKFDLFKLKNKIKKKEFKINENVLDFKLLKSKISRINIEISMGKKKRFEFISYLLTFGLIFWTHFSDLKYYKMKLISKINKIKEDDLQIEKEILKIQNEIEEKNFIFNETLSKEIIKENEIEEIIKNKDKEILEISKNIKDFDLKLEKLKKEKNIFLKEFNEQQDFILEIKNEITFIEKNSLKNITKILRVIFEIKEKNLKEIENILEKIKLQKTKINGNYKVLI